MVERLRVQNQDTIRFVGAFQFKLIGVNRRAPAGRRLKQGPQLRLVPFTVTQRKQRRADNGIVAQIERTTKCLACGLHNELLVEQEQRGG